MPNAARRIETVEKCFVALVGARVGLLFPSTPPNRRGNPMEICTNLFILAVQALARINPGSLVEAMLYVSDTDGLSPTEVVAKVAAYPQRHMLLLLACVVASDGTPEVLEAVCSCNIMTTSLLMSRSLVKASPEEYDQNSFGTMYSLWMSIFALSRMHGRGEIGVQGIEAGFFRLLAQWTLRTTDWQGRYPSALQAAQFI